MKRLLLLLLLATATLSAQTGAARRATNVAALTGHPAYYHMRPVVVVGELKLLDTGELRLTSDSLSIRVIHQGNTPEGLAEVRGEFWDLGKFAPDDPRLVGYDLRRTFGIDPEGAWPRSGQVTPFASLAPSTNSIVQVTPGLSSVRATFFPPIFT